VHVDRGGRHALVANYTGGTVAMLPVLADGALGEATATVRHEGSGTETARQSAPHPHCIVPDPANRFALVADLGIDRVVVYRLDADGGRLTRAAEGVLRPGAGPRHLAFGRDGRVVYVANELDSTVTAFRYDPETGALTAMRTVPASAGGAAARNYPADLHVHPSGRFVYVSNRGHDAIGVFAVDARTGELTPASQTPTGGSWPRNFGIEPDGRLLLVANQRGDSVVSFRVSDETGALTPTGHRVEIPSPVCIRYHA
jgi:6-phosphogluconolactonase